MRTLKRLVVYAVAGWAVVSALVALLLRQWLRERYGRGGPFPASQAGALLNPLRGPIQPARECLESFGVYRGQTVLELGPGPGYFTIEATRIVGPNGRVVCIDIQREMLAILRRRLRDHGVTNAHPLTGDATRLPLADGAVDVAFLVTVLGEIPDRPAALLELRRVLRLGGVLAVMETLRDPDYVLEATLSDLCRACGFAPLAHTRQLLGYTMTFVAPSQEPERRPAIYGRSVSPMK